MQVTLCQARKQGGMQGMHPPPPDLKKCWHGTW